VGQPFNTTQTTASRFSGWRTLRFSKGADADVAFGFLVLRSQLKRVAANNYKSSDADAFDQNAAQVCFAWELSEAGGPASPNRKTTASRISGWRTLRFSKGADFDFAFAVEVFFAPAVVLILPLSFSGAALTLPLRFSGAALFVF
jgi:hypothetical protein